MKIVIQKSEINMTNMTLLIKISKSRYRLLQKQAKTNLGKEKLDEFAEVVLNGIPLPEKYGDLVDRDTINNKFNAMCDEVEALSNQPTDKELLNKLSMCLDTAEPIIKNNYEEAEENLWK